MQPHIRWSAALAFLTFVHIQAEEIITQWNFNGGDPASPPPALGAGTAAPLGGVSVTTASGSGSSDSAGSNTAWSLASFPKQGLAARTAGAGFAVSTVGYDKLRLQFDLRASGTASRRVVVLYTVDGASFTEAAAFTLATSGAFTNRLAMDFASVPEADDNPAFAIRLVSDFADGGQYQGVSATYSTAGTWRLDMVTLLGSPIGGAPIAPAIVTSPADRTNLVGETATFSVIATGSPPLRFQWKFGTEDLAGQTNATLELPDVQLEQAGEYRVVVSNDAGSATSEPARLTVEEPPPPPVATNIAHLRSLVDPVTLEPTDTTTLFVVRGIVTTHVNLAASPDQKFFVQDDKAGIAVVVAVATSPMPAAGTEVEVTGPLGQSNGLLELQLSGTGKSHSVKALSAGHALPAPRLITASLTNDVAVADAIEGSYVTMHDVTLDTAKPDFSNTSATYQLRAADGAGFPLRVDSRTDINGQPKPVGLFDVSGVLSQSHTNAATPAADGWFLLPTRYADLVPKARPPQIDYTVRLENLIRPGDAATNSFTEQCLRTGETLTLEFTITDPDGDPVTFDRAALEAAQPTGATLAVEVIDADPPGSNSGRTIRGSLNFTASAAHAGGRFVLPLEAHDDALTNRATVVIYVPTAAEQPVAITEFLANPTSDPAAPHSNPLSRPAPPDDPASDDEYVEIVNLGATPIDLRGWTLSDAQRVRHEFGTNSLELEASGALVIFGGPADGIPPNLPVPAFAASTGSLSLNNSGDSILLRNADSNLVARVVFAGGQLATGGSLERSSADGAFAPAGAGQVPVSPGRRADGSPWNTGHPPPELTAPIRLAVTAVADHVSLSFNTEAGHAYSVLRASSPEGPYSSIAAGLTAGSFEEAPPESSAWFYRISAP